jgi:hypothetical protein
VSAGSCWAEAATDVTSAAAVQANKYVGIGG